MNKEIHMAAECMLFEKLSPDKFEAALMKFAELVRADERKANIGCIGRIAAMVVDPIDQARLYEAMDAIRARSNT